MTEITDRSPSIMPDLNEKTGTPLSGSGEPIARDVQFSYLDAPMPDDSGVGNHSSSEMRDLASDSDRKLGMPLFGLGELITGDVQFAYIDITIADDCGVFPQNRLHPRLSCDL